MSKFENLLPVMFGIKSRIDTIFITKH